MSHFIRFRVLVLGLMSFVLAACSQMPEVTPLQELNTFDGVFYTLPKTEVAISIAKVAYKKQCLNMPIECSGEEQWEKANVQKLSTFDLDHIYHIDLTSSFIHDTLLEINYNEKNFFTKIRAKDNNKSIDAVVATLKGIAEIAGSFLPLAMSSLATPPSDNTLENAMLCSKYISNLENVMNSKVDMLSGKNAGTTGNDLDVMKFRLEKLNEIESDYTKLICKKELVTKISFVADAEIDRLAKSNEDEIVYKFKQTGKSLIAEDDPTTKEALKIGDYYVVLTKMPSLASAIKDTGNLDKSYSGERSFYYRIPGQLKIAFYKVISKDGKKEYSLIHEEKVKVAQLGIIASLPLQMGGKESEVNVTFDEDTGAIKTLAVDNKSIDPALLQAVPESVAGLISAGQEGELKRLQLKRQILEEEQKIKALE